MRDPQQHLIESIRSFELNPFQNKSLAEIGFPSGGLCEQEVPKAVEQIVNLVKSQDPAVRRLGLWMASFVRGHSTATREAIAACLHDSSEGVSIRAAEVVGKFSPPTDFQVAIEGVKAGLVYHHKTRWCASQLSADDRSDPISTLSTMCKAVQGLQIADADKTFFVEILGDILKDETGRYDRAEYGYLLKSNAAKSLGHLGEQSQSAASSIIHWGRNGRKPYYSSPHAGAISALTEIGGPAAVAIPYFIEQITTSQNQDVLISAAIGLGSLGSRVDDSNLRQTALSALSAQCDSQEDQLVRELVVEAIGKFGTHVDTETLKKIEQILGAPRTEYGLKSKAVQVLGMLGKDTETCVTVLGTIAARPLESRYDSEQKSAVSAICQIANANENRGPAVNALVSLVKTPETDKRIVKAAFLGLTKLSNKTLSGEVIAELVSADALRGVVDEELLSSDISTNPDAQLSQAIEELAFASENPGEKPPQHIANDSSALAHWRSHPADWVMNKFGTVCNLALYGGIRFDVYERVVPHVSKWCMPPYAVSRLASLENVHVARLLKEARVGPEGRTEVGLSDQSHKERLLASLCGDGDANTRIKAFRDLVTLPRDDFFSVRQQIMDYFVTGPILASNSLRVQAVVVEYFVRLGVTAALQQAHKLLKSERP